MENIKTLLVLLTFVLLGQNLFCQEICDNGVDDDGDGLIDLNDASDCSCGGIIYSSNTIIESLISNPSFEDYISCPTFSSEMFKLVDWEQATDATSDYYNSNSECNFSFLTTSSLPYPHGNGIVGTIISKDYFSLGLDYVEYVGTCLLEPLTPGSEYSLSFYIASKVLTNGYSDTCNQDIFYENINITVFGNDDCNFPVQTWNCPEGIGSWMELGSINYNPQKEWSILTVSLTPSFPITSIMLGGPCDLPDSYTRSSINCQPYFLYDGLILAESPEVNVQIKYVNDLCSNTRTLDAISENNEGMFQWYYNGIAIIGATSSSLNLEEFDQGTGIYSVICTFPSNSVCSGTSIELGKKNEFPVIPNVITYNQDGINDSIDFGNYIKVCDYRADIFNRWGQLVFTQTNDSPPFLGLSSNEQELTEGVYFYVLSVSDQKISGTITIIK